MSELWHNAKIFTGILTRRVLTGPHAVQVSLVDACNYRCIMCWEHSSQLEGWGADEIARAYHESKKNKSTVMDMDVFKSLATSLGKMGTRQLSLAGIGEPLLHKQAVEAVAFARAAGLKVWLTTNGSRLNPGLLEELVDTGLEDLNVSINAGAADEYGMVHSNQEDAMFGQILDNLVWLKEYKQKKGFELPRLTLSNVVSRLNSHRALEMMETGVTVGADSVIYRPMDVFSQSRPFALKEEDYKRLHLDFRAAGELAARHDIQTNIDSFDQLVNLRFSESVPAPCFVGWVNPFVLANGDVTFCCISREVLGNLGESSFESIWFAPSRRKLNNIALRIHRTQEPVPKSRCIGCEQSLQNQKVFRYLWPLWGKAKNAGGPSVGSTSRSQDTRRA